MTAESHARRFALLDPLRGLAALWVFTFHHEFSEQFKSTVPLLNRLCGEGHLGVSMFFVISGYCLAAAARQAVSTEASPWQFAYRRMRRVYPPLWFSIALLATIPFLMEALSALKTGSYTRPSPENVNYGFMQYGLGDWASVVTLGRVFLQNGQPLSEKFTSINAVYWSLAIEVQFYVIVALGVASRTRLMHVLTATTLASVGFAAWPVAYRLGIFLPWWPMFSVGVVLYWLREKGFGPAAIFGERLCHAVSVVAVVAGIACYTGTVAVGVQWPSFVFALFVAMLIWFASVFDAQFSQALTVKGSSVRFLLSLLVLLGSMSYSIYLLHPRLQYLVGQVARQALGTHTVAYDAAVILGTIAMCYPFYRYCEAPFQRSRAVASDVLPGPPLTRTAISLETVS